MIIEFNGKKPVVSKDAFVAETAVLIGDVVIEEGASIWYGAVLRGDIGRIVVKKNSSIQDNAVVHTDEGAVCIVGENVTIGHSANIHSAVISDNSLIGINATVLSGATIPPYSIVGAGALVLENANFEEGSLIIGVPAKAVRRLDESQKKVIVEHALGYSKLAKKYIK